MTKKKTIIIIVLLLIGGFFIWRFFMGRDCGSGVEEAIVHRAGRPAAHYDRLQNKDTVLVFLHGIFGDAESTWIAPPDTYWPELVVQDPTFNNADIYVAAYNTEQNKMTIDEVVGNLNQHLIRDGVFSRHRQVVFVCHSLGGLILQRFLLTHRKYAKKVRLIYFYATPQTGAQIATLGRLFSNDPLLREMAPGGSNDYLMNLEAEWQNAGFNIPRRCAYEKREYKCVLVVDQLSATRHCDESVALNKNHVTIVKPTSADDDPHIILRNAWNDLFSPHAGSTPTAPSSPSSTPVTSPTDPRPPSNPPPSEFTVKVEDEGGQVIPLAKVSCSTTTPGPSPTELSDDDGEYTCPAIPKNQKYIWISAQASGYAIATDERFVVASKPPHILKLKH